MTGKVDEVNGSRSVPFRRKLLLLILSTCSTALLCACVILAVYQMWESRNTMVRDMTILADVLARNVRAALTFHDDEAAQRTLSALETEPSIIAADLYDDAGSLFANYSPTNHTVRLRSMPEVDGHWFAQGRLHIVRPVVLNEKRIGTIYIQSDLRGARQRLMFFGGIAIVVVLFSCFAAMVVAGRLQKAVSGPILDLAETARKIAGRKDYSIRVREDGPTEVRFLTGSFNQLLNSIEERDVALRNTNAALQQEVVERRSAEDRVTAQLARLELLHRITRAIGERQDLPSIFQVVIRTIEDQLPLDFCCIARYEPTENCIVVSGVGVRSESTAMELAMTERSRVEIDENGLSQCVQGRLVYEPDIKDSQFPFPHRLSQGGLRSLVVAPLLVESHVFGVMVAARRQRNAFSSGECEFLRQLCEHVALAAHQAQLHTALQDAYNDLRQTQQAIMQQERLRALGQMASGVAHDINNAISPVALYTESLLESEPNLSAKARNYLTTIQNAVDDVTHTVARMREFYRQREPELTLTPLNVNALIDQVIDLSRARWSDMPQQRGVHIEIRTERAEKLPPIMGVESEIREALVNLVFNAVDAMPQGGILTFRTRFEEQPHTGSNGTGPRVLIEVADSGVGMSEDTRRRCMEPFFTTKGERGTGLGLAMVYGSVRRHNGEIEIDSVPGKGTTFRLVFRAAESASAATEKSEPARLPTRLNILVIDDDPILIKSLRDILEGDGHYVTTANSGQSGVETFSAALQSRTPFSVVFTDLGMPHMDGRQVAAAIKKASRETPVILLTGWGQRLVAENDVPADVDRVLNKPPRLRDLRDALARCVPTSAS